jgi:putative transcriptional regulator
MRGSRFLAAALTLIATLTLLARSGVDEEVRVGTLLVADRDLKDRNFAQTAILIAQYDDEGTLGIILNRQTDVPLNKALPKWREARSHAEPVYLGGPVEKGAMMALLRTRTPPQGAFKITRDVHLIAEPAQLKKTLKGASPEQLRVYFGYVGWAPEQLEGEIEDGAWHVFPFDPNIVFDPDPDSVWTRLIKNTETQIARR